VRTVPGQAEASAKLLPRPPQGEQQTLPGDDLQLAPLKTDLTCRLIGHGAKWSSSILPEYIDSDPLEVVISPGLFTRSEEV
jgi:hypothetical protein